MPHTHRRHSATFDSLRLAVLYALALWMFLVEVVWFTWLRLG
jgi:hypothetical protein